VTDEIDLTLRPQVPWGRWMLVELDPQLNASRVRVIQLATLNLPGVVSVQDMSCVYQEMLDDILMKPDSTVVRDVPPRERVIQPELMA